MRRLILLCFCVCAFSISNAQEFSFSTSQKLKFLEDENKEFNSPLLSDDGAFLYFLRSTKGEENDEKYYLFQAELASNSNRLYVIDEKVLLGPIVHDKIIGISKNSNEIFLTQSGKRSASAGVFSVTLENNNWQPPKEVAVDGLRRKSIIYGGHMLPELGWMFLSLDDPRLKGDGKIFLSEQRPDGTWSWPMLLDASLNRNKHVANPFFNKESRYLLYSKKRKGDADIFSSKNTNLTWDEWTEEQSISPFVNTISPEENAFVGNGTLFFNRTNSDGERSIYFTRNLEHSFTAGTEQEVTQSQQDEVVQGSTIVSAEETTIEAINKIWDLDESTRVNINATGETVDVRSPIINLGGDKLFFITKPKEERILENLNHGFAVRLLRKLENGEWYFDESGLGNLQDIPFSDVIGINKGGNSLYFLQSYDADKNLKAGVFVSKKVRNNWSIPEPVDVTGIKRKDQFEGGYIHPNERLIVVSKASKNIDSGLDLYLLEQDQGGKWSWPVALNMPINSSSDEAYPSLSFDKSKLFYSIKKNGNYDNYVSFRKGNDWNSWGSPISIGSSLNTIANEKYLNVESEGLVFYTSDKEKVSDELFLSFAYVPGEKQSMPSSTDAVAQAEATETSTKVEASEAKEVGEETLVDESLSENTSEVEVPSLAPLHFSFNAIELDDESKKTLAKVKELMLQNASVDLLLIGHTDSKGDAIFNQKLGLKRGEQTKAELVQFGIKEDRILVDSAGESAPIADNDKEEGRKKNRRVELMLLPRR